MRVITDEEVLDNDYYRWVMKGVVCGVGVYEKDGWRVDAVHTTKYRLWVDMLARCYDGRFHARMPTYKNCQVSDNFKDFKYFSEWCDKQVGFNLPRYHLDKDILVKGNKVYSEETCCFVPEEIDMSNQNRVVSVKFFDDDAGLKAEHSLVAEYQVTTRVSDQMTISKVLLTEDVAGDIELHNGIRANTVDLHILKQTGNKVMLQPVEFEDLRVEVRQV